MAIRVVVEFELDAQAWANEYGLSEDDARQDAEQHMQFLVASSVEQLSPVQNGLVKLKEQ